MLYVITLYGQQYSKASDFLITTTDK